MGNRLNSEVSTTYFRSRLLAKRKYYILEVLGALRPSTSGSQFQFLAFYCRTKTSTTKGLDQMHNCISRVFTTKQKSKYYVMNNEKNDLSGIGSTMVYVIMELQLLQIWPFKELANFMLALKNLGLCSSIKEGGVFQFLRRIQ